MFRCSDKGPADNGPPMAETAQRLKTLGGGYRRQARESWTGVAEHRLGMVGERSPGEEGES